VVVCKSCGKQFHLRASRVARSKTGPFCSTECKTKSQELGLDIEWLHDQYTNKSRYIKDIATEVGCSYTAVHKALIRANIPRRSRSYAHVGRKHAKESIEKIAKSKIGKPRPAEVCQKISESRMGKYKGAQNPNWRGGLSYEPYCFRFDYKLKENVRDAFGRKCYLCPKTENKRGRKLSVHHVDYNKSQGCAGLKWSLIPLCSKCHSMTNFNRWYWFALLRDYWIYDYMDFNLMRVEIG
jgi:endogenous inhibitor of DNA gyrase (YacG/DUF329 family)